MRSEGAYVGQGPRRVHIGTSTGSREHMTQLLGRGHTWCKYSVHTFTRVTWPEDGDILDRERLILAVHRGG